MSNPTLLFLRYHSFTYFILSYPILSYYFFLNCTALHCIVLYCHVFLSLTLTLALSLPPLFETMLTPRRHGFIKAFSDDPEGLQRGPYLIPLHSTPVYSLQIYHSHLMFNYFVIKFNITLLVFSVLYHLSFQWIYIDLFICLFIHSFIHLFINLLTY